jgi:hypothetical protein
MGEKCGEKLSASETKESRDQNAKKMQVLKEIMEMAEILLENGLSGDAIKDRMNHPEPDEPDSIADGQGSQSHRISLSPSQFQSNTSTWDGTSSTRIQIARQSVKTNIHMPLSAIPQGCQIR